jgi:hypothetical protein
MGGEFPANSDRVRKNNRCDIFARLKRGRSLPFLSELSRLLSLSPATPPRSAESLENDGAATWAVSKRLESSRMTLHTFPLVGGVSNTHEAVHAE